MVTTNRFLFTIATLIVGGSFALSYSMDDWHWFQRSGAMLASIGAILSSRPVLRTTIDTMLERLRVNGESIPELRYRMTFVPEDPGLWRYGWSYLPRGSNPPGLEE